MFDWIFSGIGAWIGNKFWGNWVKNNRNLARLVIVGIVTLAAVVLLFL